MYMILAGIVLGPRMWRLTSAPTDELPDFLTRRTRAHLEMVGLALDAFEHDHGEYPAALHALKPDSGPTYIKGSNYDRDAWGDALRYRVPGKEHPFDLYSRGVNGIDEAGGGDDIDLWPR